ncbi:MAG: zinc dependent phospholipase C family protein, partial [Eubacterium sp.]|nr:zinc dependent phospholipase C family protein [Eubacterium sp.]
MPAFSTHYIFAKEMMDTLKEIADFKINENVVFIGAQGPDIFFFHRAFPWQLGKPLRKLGSLLHRKKAGILLNKLSEYCRKNESSIAKSYAFGFILHYSLDRICHPYVYYLQNKITEKQPEFNPHSAHNIIELSLDSLMLSLHLNIEKPTLFETESTIKINENELAEISDEIAFLADISSENAKTAILDMKNMQHLLLDKNGKKKKAAMKLEKMASPFTKNFLLSSYFRTNDLEKAKIYANIC